MCSHSSAVRGRMQAGPHPTASLPLAISRARAPPPGWEPGQGRPGSKSRSPQRETCQSGHPGSLGRRPPAGSGGAILAAPRARGGIGRRARLRALWRLFSVVVRVHSGALKNPWKPGLFLVKGSSVAQERYCSVLGQWPSRTICRTFCVPDVRQDEPHDLRRQEPLSSQPRSPTCAAGETLTAAGRHAGSRTRSRRECSLNGHEASGQAGPSELQLYKGCVGGALAGRRWSAALASLR